MHIILFEPWRQLGEFQKVLDQLSHLNIYVSVISSCEPYTNFGFVHWSTVDIHSKEQLKSAYRYISEVMEVDGVLPWEDVGVIPAAWLREEYNLYGAPRDVCAIVKNKFAAKRKIGALNVAVPKCVLVTPDSDFEELAEYLGIPFVLKPNFASGSIGVRKVSSSHEFQKHLLELENYCVPQYPMLFKEKAAKYCAEEYIKGKLVSLNGIAQQNNIEIFDIIDHWSEEPWFLDQFHTMPSLLPDLKKHELEADVKRVIEGLRAYPSAFQVEFIVGESGSYMIDMALRPGADYLVTDLIPKVCGVNFVSRYVEVMTGGLRLSEKKISTPSRGYFGVVYKVCNREGRFLNLVGVEKAQGSLGIVEVNSEIRPEQYITLPPRGYDNCRYVSLIAAADTMDDLHIRIRNAANCIDYVLDGDKI